ncbi:MAG: helix-turn-helix domain-containing protein [Pseudomonadota bacterium]
MTRDSAPTDKQKRRRYSPRVRRAMILDAAAEMVARNGVSSVSFEAVSQEAGISKSLVYNYFDGVPDLLKELLERELREQRRLQFEAAERATTFEELVRFITREYLSYIDRRGLIIERLQADPASSDKNMPAFYSKSPAVDYLAPLVAQHFDLPELEARAATEVSFGLPAAAGEYLLRREMDLQALEDLTVSMIIGAIVRARNDYLAQRRTLQR